MLSRLEGVVLDRLEEQIKKPLRESSLDPSPECVVICPTSPKWVGTSPQPGGHPSMREPKVGRIGTPRRASLVLVVARTIAT